jgi:Protein phosphatase 2C
MTRSGWAGAYMRLMLATDPGTPGWPNEDFAAIGPGAAVLLDGATTVPRSADTGCGHGVAWYSRTLGAALLARITAEPPVPLAAALADAIAHVRDLHQGTCDLTNPITPAATVTAVRADPDGIGYLALSDSSVAADYSDGRQPLILTDRHPGAKASPDAARHATTGTLPREGLRGVVLLSDGATRITDLYHLLSWPGVIDVVRDLGPAELIRQVRAAEDSDPACERWPREKPRDDATIVYWHCG